MEGAAKTQLSILMLEDNPLDVDLIRTALIKEGFDCQLTCVTSREEFVAAIERQTFDLILSDYSLPQFTGLDALRICRFRRVDIPFILVSGTLGEEMAVECVKSGATDYVLKQRLARLGAAVRRALQETAERTRRRQMEGSMRELTGRLLRLQDEERRRLARELHDGVAQTLVALSANLSALQDEIPTESERSHSVLTDCATLTDDAIKSIRTLSYLLHPPVLDMLGLPGALRDYVEGFSRRSGIAVELELAEDFGRLLPEVETALFRVVQESLTNVHKHSGSQTARISLRREKAAIDLDVRDFGRGFGSNSTAASPALVGVGIAGMRERLQQFGGSLDIESNTEGTRIHAVVPLERALVPATEARRP